MRRFKLKYLILALIALVLSLGGAALMAARREPVSLTILGYTTKRSSDGRPYHIVQLAITNQSLSPLTYWAAISKDNVQTTLLLPDSQVSGWRRLGVSCGFGISSFQLPPGAGLECSTFLPDDTPCKIGFDYLREPTGWNRLAEKLPAWLAKYLPTATNGMAVTPVIQPRPLPIFTAPPAHASTEN